MALKVGPQEVVANTGYWVGNPYGLKGADGTKGEPGGIGAKGGPGEDGAGGAKGGPGEDGAAADKGAKGPVGEKGGPGEDGLYGGDGTYGGDGVYGGDGTYGGDGIYGGDGVPGATGGDGEKGEPGADGVDSTVDGDKGQPGVDLAAYGYIEVTATMDPDETDSGTNGVPVITSTTCSSGTILIPVLSEVIYMLPLNFTGGEATEWCKATGQGTGTLTCSAYALPFAPGLPGIENSGRTECKCAAVCMG